MRLLLGYKLLTFQFIQAYSIVSDRKLGNLLHFDPLIALIVSEGRGGYKVEAGFVCTNISVVCPFKGYT